MKQPFVFAFAVFFFISPLFARFDSQAQSRKRVPIAYQNSEISFTGDDSFITRRSAWEPFLSGHIWEKSLLFSNGFISYSEFQPGYYYTGENAGKDSFVDTFNGSSWIGRRNVKISEQDVKEGANDDGDFYYDTKGNGNQACGLAKIFAGTTVLTGGGISVGNKVAGVYICWESYDGTVSEMENKLIDIMLRMRLDEGKLNKARGAR